MGTSTVALAAAVFVAAALALIAWLAVRARNRSEARTRDAIWHVSQVIDAFSDQLGGMAESRGRDDTIPLPITLDLDDGLRKVAALAAALPGMTSGAARVDLIDGGVSYKAVGITSGVTGLEHAPDPPDGAGWSTATVRWAHVAGGEAGGRPIQTGVVAPILDPTGARIGLVAGYTDAPAVEQEIIAAVDALAASAAPILGAAREHVALQALVRTDPRTGLLNQRGLEEGLAREVARSARAGTPLSLLMIDLDDFRRFNKVDHTVGDAVLIGFARVLRDACRESDIPCRRSNGEEFTVILPDTTCAAALRVDARIRALVSTADLPVPAGDRLTYSAGITMLREGDDVASIDKRASELVNAAKLAGKNGVYHDCGELSAPAPALAPDASAVDG